MPSISLPMAVVGSSVIGAAGSAFGANAQAGAANHAADIQQHMYDTTRGDLLPFTQIGQGAAQQISSMSPFNFAPTQAQLEATPGYQFNLSQGLKATQNGAAAQGLGSSGAALKGAATYASGLADTTYQNQFSNALNTYNSNLGRLQGLATLGESAGAQTGAIGSETAKNAGQAVIAGGNAIANGAAGVSGNLGQGLIGNSFFNSQGSGMYGSSMTAANMSPAQADLFEGLY
jgi:hypothetical protein